MLLLELEALLEGGLYALGIDFKPRQYGEDIRMGVSIDDALGEQTVEEGYRPKPGEDMRNWVLRTSNDLTEYQQEWGADALDGEFPFFFRESGINNGVLLHYIVCTSEDMPFAEKADDIVKERKIRFESLDIAISHPKLKSPLQLVGFELEPETGGVQYSLYKYCKLSPLPLKLPESQQAIYERLTQKEYSLQEAYQIAIDFLKA